MNSSDLTAEASPDTVAKPKPAIRRSNLAPAYYLGRPADEWIAVMRPRRRPLAAAQPAAGLASASCPPAECEALPEEAQAAFEHIVA